MIRNGPIFEILSLVNPIMSVASLPIQPYMFITYFIYYVICLFWTQFMFFQRNPNTLLVALY